MVDEAHPVALSFRSVRKSYYGVPVLKGIDIDVRPGEIHALIGENGAGKSTLMNILFGMPVIHETGGFEGDVVIGETSVNAKTPAEAMAAGVGMVHQEFMLLPGFTITENVKLNRERTRPNAVSAALRVLAASRSLRSLDYPRMNEETSKALTHIGLSIDETTGVDTLPVGHMQMVEIAREVDKEALKVLVFDEPTAVLTETEADQLLEVMKRLAAEGIAILFISHRLDEITAIADRVTVLRDGEHVGCLEGDEIDVKTMARLMIGRNIVPRDTDADGERAERAMTVMEVRDLVVDMPGERVRGVDLDVRDGEIFGIAGLAGQGKLGIANGVMGLHPASGSVTFGGRALALNDPRRALERGLAFVSEDRRNVGLLLRRSVADNITSTAIEVQRRFLRGAGPLALFDRGAGDRHTLSLIEEFDIRCRGPKEPVHRLSGGNQQKVCLARAFTLKPTLLFVSEPTRGIDVGAKDRVLNLLLDLNRRHETTIVVTSSELGELRRLCDRIAVIDEGRVAGILAPDASDVEFGLLFGGQRV
jgi:simple sugar transport system ATP-binding protein